MHLVGGDRDPLVHDGRRLDRRLAAAGAEHEVLEPPGGYHQVAVAADGPAAQEARRFQIAVRAALGIDERAAR